MCFGNTMGDGTVVQIQALTWHHEMEFPQVFRFVAQWKNVFGICLHHGTPFIWTETPHTLAQGIIFILLLIWFITTYILLYTVVLSSIRTALSCGLWTKFYNVFYNCCSGHVTRVFGFAFLRIYWHYKTITVFYVLLLETSTPNTKQIFAWLC